MNHLFKRIVILALVLIATISLSINVAAFDWDLKVGEEYSLQHSETPYISSNTAVIEIRFDGNLRYTAVAVGEGTATITGGSLIGTPIEEYVITVKAATVPSENKETTTTTNKIFSENILSGHDNESIMDGGFVLFIIFFAIVFSFIAFIFTLVIATAIKCKKLDNAIRTLNVNPCQQTAEAAVAEFTKMNGLLRFNISNGSDTRGVHFTMWREVFNQTVIPCRTIKSETKEALRQAMLRLNTHSLYNVIHTENGKEAAEAFGSAGEDNVWHNLKTMLGCDVYRNVRIRNGATSSEIDAIIVSEDKGIFLLEIKSIGGIATPDGNKAITYNLLREDPSNQIYRHESDFISYFSNIDLKNKIKNVLVFSWPYGETRRWIATNTFPQTDYAIITVEQLIAHFKTQPVVSLSQHEKQILADKLKSCSTESILR